MNWQAVRVSRRDEVLQAALDLLDEVGLDALTIRRLAERLGVQPGALYRHFDSKLQLLQAMVDDLVSTEPPATAGRIGADWDERVRAMATALRSMMLTRRDGARLVVSYLHPGRTAEQAWATFVATLQQAGLAQPQAVVAVDTVVAFVNGFTIEEQARDGHPSAPDQRARRDDAFDAGLTLIINGIRTRIAG